MMKTEPISDAAARQAAQSEAKEPAQPAQSGPAQPMLPPLALAALKSGPIDREVVLKLIDGLKLL